MTRQSTEPLTEYRLSASNRSASEVAGTMLEFLDTTPPYQRGDVWTEDQRVALMKSWIMGIPVPAITLNDRATPVWREHSGEDVRQQEGVVWAVVDGKQRIETARQWFSDSLMVPASWFDWGWVQATEATDDGPYVAFLDLTREAQLFCKRSFLLPVIEAKLPTIEAEAELYLLVNGGGTAQTEADMINAKKVAGR